MFNRPEGAEFYQIFWLPAGYYQFTVQGFYRGSYNPAYWDGNETIRAEFFGDCVTLDDETGEVLEVTRASSVPLLSIASSEWSEGRFYEVPNAAGDNLEWYSDSQYSHDGVSYYVPNSMDGTRIWFDNDFYTGNVLKVINVSDSWFKIGIRKTGTQANDWCIFSNFQATYVSDAGEGVQLELAREDFEKAMNKAEDFIETLGEAGYESLLGYFEDALSDIEYEAADYTSPDQFVEANNTVNNLLTDYKKYLADAKSLTNYIVSCYSLLETTDYPGLADFQAAIVAAEQVEGDKYNEEGTGGVYTTSGADYSRALKDLQNARAAYLASNGMGEDGKMDMSELIAYPFFCLPQYNPEWSEDLNRWVSQDIVLNGDGVKQGWSDLRESSDNDSAPDDRTTITETRVRIAEGISIGTDQSVKGQWYQVNTSGYIPYWNHGLSSAKQWATPGSEREIAQNLSGLPNGYYSIQGCGITWGNDWSDSNPCRMGIRIQADGQVVESEEETKFSGWWGNDYNDWTYYHTGMINITGGEARLSFFANGFSSFTGMQLFYYGENPDFSTMIASKIADIQVDIETLKLEGDKAAVNAMLDEVKLPIVGYDAYLEADAKLNDALTYISTANAYLDANDPSEKFLDLQINFDYDSNESKYLETAVGYTFALYDDATTTYKDVQACMNDYYEYEKYIDLVQSYTDGNPNAELLEKIDEQAQKLIADYANVEKLKEYEAELAEIYNKQTIDELGFDKATVDNPVDATVLITNPSYTEDHKGWSGEFTVDNGLQNAERYNSNFRMEQTLYSLPAGFYTIQVKAYYRDGGAGAAFDNAYYGEFTPNMKMFANDKEIDVVSMCNENAVFTERSYTEYYFTATNPNAELGEEDATLRAWVEESEYYDEEGQYVDENGDAITYDVTSWAEAFGDDGKLYDTSRDDAWIYDSFFTLDGMTRYFYPNSMRGAGARFANDNGAYTNSITIEVTEGGNINFGLYKDVTIDGDWCMFDDWKLFYLGKTAPVGINNATVKNAVAKQYYTLDGRSINAPQKGINIVKMSDGSVKKIYIK